MKVIKLIVFGMMLTFAGFMQGQLSVRFSLGTPPAWGPEGYNNVRYYYLPDLEAYYDVQNSMFIYISGNRWVHRSYLPSRYRGYDLYNGYKVVMNGYYGNSPYANFREYRMKYRRGYRDDEQRNIGVRNDRNNYRENHPDFQQNRNDDRGDYRSQGRNEDNQVRGNDRDQNRGNGNENKHQRGNERNKKEGRDHEED